MRKILLNFVLWAMCFGLCACSFQTKHRGYIFPEDLDAEVAGIKTAAQLEEKFGSPMAKTMHGESVWIYYGADENYRGPLRLTYDNQIVLLAWTDGGLVSKIRILRDGDLPEVKIAEGETKIPAAIELNAFEELVSNVGRFKPAGLGQ